MALMLMPPKSWEARIHCTERKKASEVKVSEFLMTVSAKSVVASKVLAPNSWFGSNVVAVFMLKRVEKAGQYPVESLMIFPVNANSCTSACNLCCLGWAPGARWI